MAKFGPFLNAATKFASTDFSDHIQSVSVSMSPADVPDTAMGASGVTRKPGLRDDSFQLTFHSDYAAGSVDAFMYAQIAGGSLFLVEVWPNGTTTAAGNPKFSGTCIITDWAPIDGSVGDNAVSTVTLPVSGVITRATA